MIETLSKPRRQRQRELHQTKGLMSRTMAVHIHCKSLYISLLSSAQQQREMAKGWFSLAHKLRYNPTYADAVRC